MIWRVMQEILNAMQSQSARDANGSFSSQSFSNRSLRKIALGTVGLISLLTVTTSTIDAISIAATQPSPIRPPTTCPDHLEDLMTLLLRDLPSYANRVTARSFDAPIGVSSRRLNEPRPGYVLLAGQPEFGPLTLGPGNYVSTQPIADQPSQIFFTTLERQYTANRSVNLQHYHWLFLTRSTSGWQLVALFSRIGDEPADQPPTPPQDRTQGAIAQAIRLWLQDCRSGAISPP
jgi:hypothetical protein